ncbi:hypothetical protein [Methylobacterium organophilum]|uniref:Uncharacterized protein n=1 Tax=Methylobacterium organophilum TaxID=410 RepID=A0ABQ4T2S7_METOR|nr:hypothetical protein [Methylobacterium organophilum]GJE25828.1 hypothetical protein LKMONMHP_0671 [Methylobacterium organophilum]
MAFDALDDSATAARDRRLAWAIAALVAATVLIGALAPAPQKQAALAPENDPSCAEWGNGCVVCQRLAEGPACSLPGIACTPATTRCLRAAGEP